MGCVHSKPNVNSIAPSNPDLINEERESDVKQVVSIKRDVDISTKTAIVQDNRRESSRGRPGLTEDDLAHLKKKEGETLPVEHVVEEGNHNDNKNVNNNFTPSKNEKLIIQNGDKNAIVPKNNNIVKEERIEQEDKKIDENIVKIENLDKNNKKDDGMAEKDKKQKDNDGVMHKDDDAILKNEEQISNLHKEEQKEEHRDSKKQKKMVKLTRKKSATKTGVKVVDEDDEGEIKKINQYNIEQFLGKGQFGNVYRVKDTSKNISYAMKVLDKRRLLKKRIGRQGNALMLVKTEIAVWKKLLHPNCLCLYEVIEDENKFFLVSEYIDGGASMDDNIEGEPFSLKQARNIFFQLIEGLEYLHFHNITHQDIKPGNILITSEGVVKIADYGVSVVLDESGEKSSATKGTAAFMSPEMTDGRNFDPKLCDIWACAISLYMFVYGHTPFMAKNISDIYYQIQNAEPIFPSEPNDPLLHDLLKNMLDKDVNKRLTIEQIQEHPWLAPELDKEDAENRRLRKMSSWSSESLIVTEEDVNKCFTPKSNFGQLVTAVSFAKSMKRNSFVSKSDLLKEEFDEDVESQELEAAAQKIQKIQRGRIARRKVKAKKAHPLILDKKL